MSDALVVISIIAFFGLCVALVRACDKIIGPDGDVVSGDTDSEVSDREPPAYTELPK